MKKVMILGGSDLQVPAIKKTIEMGYQPIVCDYYEDCPGKRIEGVIPELISTYDYDGVLDAALKHNIDAILTICTDYPTRIVAYVAEKMGLKGISLETAINSTDKGKMRACMKKAGIPVPRFFVVKNEKEFLDKIVDFTDGVVVKAVDNSGSRGIMLLTALEEESELLKAYEYCKSFSRSGDVLLEEYMRGKEICVEMLNFEGNCNVIRITDQLSKEPPYFTDAGFCQGSTLEENIQSQIKDIAKKACEALGITQSAAMVEMIVTDEGPKIVEVGPRLAGDYTTSHLAPLSCGVDMVGGAIQIALGEKPDVTVKYDKGACIKYYLKPVEGKIRAFKGVEEANNVDGVVMVKMMKKIGEIAVPLRESNDRLGFVIAKGDTPQEALQICEYALEKIKVEVE